MADKDDKDTSFGGSQGGYGKSPGGGGAVPGNSWANDKGNTSTPSTNTGGGSNINDARNDTPSYGNPSPGNNSNYGNSPGGNNNSPGFGWANDKGNNTPTGTSPGGNTNPGGNVPGNSYANDKGNNTPANTPTGMTPGTRGLGSVLGGDSLVSRVANIPNGFNPDRFGINPNINPDRFAPGLSAATGPTPTNYTPGRYGMAVPTPTGMTPYETLRAIDESMQDPMTGMPRDYRRPMQREILREEQRPQGFPGATTTPAAMTERAALGTTNPATGLPTRANAPGMSMAGTERAPAAPTPTGYNPSTGMVGGTIDPNQFSNPAMYGAAARVAENQSMRDLANMNVPGNTMAGTERSLDLPTQAETAAATPTDYPTTLGGVPLGGQPAPAPTGPTGFGRAVIGNPVTPAMVAPPDIVDAPPLTGRIDLAAAPKADIVYAPGARQTLSDIDQRRAAAVAAVMGDVPTRITITSGRRPTPRGVYDPTTGKISSGRHVEFAADSTVEVMEDGKWRSLSYANPADAKTLKEINRVGMADFGILSAGYGKRHGQYMGPTKTHVDIDPRANSWESAHEFDDTWAEAREAYRAAGNTPAPQQPVASMMASPSETTPQMAALNDYRTTAVASTAPAPVDAAGRTVSTAAPGTGGYPATPAGSVQDEGRLTTPSPAPRGTEAAAGGTVTTEAAPPGTAGFPATPPKEAQAPGFPSRQTPATGYQRSGLLTALGLGIDAVGAVAGGPVSLGVNLLSGVAFGDTPGGLIADAVGGKYGPNQYAPGRDDKYSGDRGTVGSGGQNTRGVNNPETIGTGKTTTPGPTTTTAPVTPTADEFIDKYIAPTNNYPTPFENWGKDFGWSKPI